MQLQGKPWHEEVTVKQRRIKLNYQETGTQGDPLISSAHAIHWEAGRRGQESQDAYSQWEGNHFDEAQGPRCTGFRQSVYGRSPHILLILLQIFLAYLQNTYLIHSFRTRWPLIVSYTLKEQVSGLGTKSKLGRGGMSRKGFFFFFLAPLTNASC